MFYIHIESSNDLQLSPMGKDERKVMKKFICRKLLELGEETYRKWKGGDSSILICRYNCMHGQFFLHKYIGVLPYNPLLFCSPLSVSVFSHFFVLISYN